jgi:hypothetical protein
MLYDGLELNARLRLLGLEIHRAGKLIIWFSSNFESGNQRWAAIYEYKGGYYAQSTDAGQTCPYAALSGAFARTISDIDMSSLKIGGILKSSKESMGLLREELRDPKYRIPGLDSQRIEALANKMPCGDHVEEKTLGDATLDEFLHRRETANATGSIFQLWPGEDPEEWKGNFLELLEANGREVYIHSWDGGMCSNGVEYIEEFLGHYWAEKSMEGTSGPYESFPDVFEDEYFRGVGSGTESIWCSEMSTEELLSKLILDKEDLEVGFTVEINDKPYVITEDFRLVPSE